MNISGTVLLGLASIAVALLMLAIAAGYLCGFSWLVMILYNGLVSEEWVRPVYLQWVGIVFVGHMFIGMWRRG